MTDISQSDEQLFASFQKGDSQSFDWLYHRYKDPVYRYLIRQGFDTSINDDIFQDAWMKVIHAKKQKLSAGGFKPWLYAIVRNTSIDFMRKQQIRVAENIEDNADRIENPISTEQKVSDMDCHELLKQSVQSLAMTQRECFLLQHEAGFSLQQIASLLQVGRETIKSRLRYAMQQLKIKMEECLS